jgi:hypothetical protein
MVRKITRRLANDARLTLTGSAINFACGKVVDKFVNALWAQVKIAREICIVFVDKFAHFVNYFWMTISTLKVEFFLRYV